MTSEIPSPDPSEADLPSNPSTPEAQEQAEAERHQVYAHIVDTYDGMVCTCKDEGRPFGITEVERLVDLGGSVSLDQTEARRTVLAMALGNTELHESTRASIVKELAKQA